MMLRIPGLLLLWLITMAPVCSEAKPRRPFPQHVKYAEGTLLPSAPEAERDAIVIGFYQFWKERYLFTAGKGEFYVYSHPEKGEIPASREESRAVSEGQGYGMLISVMMAGADPQAQTVFDGLYRHVQANPARKSRYLMAWRQIYKKGELKPVENVNDLSSATDGDLDIACALLLADRQWGSKGEIDYRQEGLKRLEAILKEETDAKRRVFLLGDWVDPKEKHAGGIRPSDFLPAHLRTFSAASDDPRWKALLERYYAIFAGMVSATIPPTGLLPDFAVEEEENPGRYLPAPRNYLEGNFDGAYFYNACRIPWRLGCDYLLHSDRRALAVLDPLNRWLREATGGKPEAIVAGYQLDGTPLGKDRSVAFLAPLAVAAMIPPESEGAQEWLDALWVAVVRSNPDEDAYYGNTLKMLSLIVLSGNWWQ